MPLRLLSLLFLTFFSYVLNAQCLQVLDGAGVFTDNPYFVSCTPGNFDVFIQPDRNIGPYVINWGDGSPNSTGASLTTAQNVSHTYTATTDTFNITITDNGSGCVIMGVAVLERNPLASIQLPAGDDNFGCTPVQFRFINSSTQVSETTTFTWDFGDGSPTVTFDYTNLGDTVLHTYLPGVGVQSCNLNVTLTATNYCGSSTASFFPLRVWDLDEAMITPSATLLCYPDTVVQYTNSTIRNCFPEGNQSQRYERWNFGDYWGLGYDSIIEWRPWNPPITAPPPMAYPGIGTYFVTLQDSSFCGLDDVTISIQITNPPTSIISSNKDTICEDESVVFSNNSIGGANTYLWNFDSGSGFQSLNGNNKTRFYNSAGDYTIELIVSIAGAQGCRDTSSVDLHVLPSPTSDFTFDTNNECDSMNVNFTDASTGANTSYNWNFGNGMTFNGISPPSQFYANPGSYNVSLRVANIRGCLDFETKTVRVRESPVAGFTVSSVCLNTQASFIDLSTSGGDPITSYQWTFGDGFSSTQQNPFHLYTAFGTYTVTQIVSNGFCADTISQMVTVENRPTAAFVSSPDNGCSRLTVNFTNQSSANATNFRWDFGDGSSPVFTQDTFHVFTNNGINDTTFTIEMIAFTAFGCTDTIYDTVTVSPVPTPSFTSDAVVDCGPVSVSFTNTTLGDSLNYFWNFGDGSAIVNDTNPTHIFNNQTLFINNYIVQLVVASNTGCRDTTSQIVTIYPEPIFTFSTVPDSGCSPLSVTFPSVVGAVDYQWDFGDGSTGSGPTPTHIYVNNSTNNQTYTVRLVAQNSFGCRDTTFGSVLVFPNPSSNFSLDTNIGCQPLPIQITNNSTGANVFNWDFGDGTSSTNTNATFNKTYTNLSALTQFFDLELIVETTNGCRDTSTLPIEVHPFIQAAFNSDTVGCSPLAIPFNNQSFGALNYSWTFGDGGTSGAINPNHTYTNTTTGSQNFTAQLIAVSAKGCLDSVNKTIEVYPKPIASYSLSTNLGCQPLEVTFTNASSIADSCIWRYGDQDTFRLCTPTNMHTYTNTSSFFPINYISQLIVLTDNGCSDTLERTITVNPQIIADFSSDTAGCSPFPVNFQNQSVGAQNFQWNFGDGANSFSSNPSNLYTNTTLSDITYNAELIAMSQYGCNDTIQKAIEIFSKPVANFSTDVNTGCHPLPVTFTNASQIADSCSWNFGDGSMLLDTCFTTRIHTFQNTISSVPLNRMAELFVFTDNGCSDTITQTIVVNPEIIARYTSDTVGCSPLLVNFQNQSIGAQTFLWTYGDGGNSSNANTSNVYNNTGFTTVNYNSQLVVTSQFGCTDIATQNIEVFAKPVANFSTDVNTGCHPLPVTFTNNSQIEDSCRWDFGDGSMILDSCFNTQVHTYQNTISSVPLSNLAQLFVYTDNGCSDTISQTIIVNPEIIARYTSDTVGCSPLLVNFQNQSIGAQTFLWTYGDGGNSSNANTSNVYNNTGFTTVNYNSQLVVTSQFGCTDIATQNIEVFAKPIANFSTDVNTGCHPLPVTFTNNSQIEDSCRWDFGDGSMILDSCFNTQVHTYQNTISSVPLNNLAQLFVYTDNGCSDTITQTIIVNPEIIASYTSDTVGCSPLVVNFQNQSIGAQTFQWTYGDGGNSFNTNTSNTYNNTSLATINYSSQLVATSQYGCTDIATQNIEVFAKPIASFIPDVTSGCHPLPVTITNTSQIADSCSWDFGDGSAVIDSCFNTRLHTYQNTLSSVPVSRNAQFFVYTNNGCSDTVNHIISINPRINADFNADSMGCNPLRIDFQNQSVGVHTYEWTFGDGGTSPQIDPTHFFINSGLVDTVFTTKLKVTSNFGCADSLNHDITVFPKPTADYTISTNDGCQPLEVNFTNNSTITDSCIWTYGDGNQLSDCSIQTMHTYTNALSLVPLNYKSQLVILTDRGCSDTLDRNINVRPQVIADFSSDSIACSPLDATFRSQSFGAISYSWDYGDGIQANGMITTHQFTNTGTTDSLFNVRLIAQSLYNCNDTIIKTVRVRPTPIVGFTANPLQQEFPNSTVFLTNTSNPGNWNFNWNFGDTNFSNLRDPGSHTYQTWGNYNIQLKASTQFCSDSTDVNVLIEAPTPIADFGDSARGCEPLEVTFINKSIYGNTFRWDFGDGGTSNSENPTHIYFNEGVYNVKLTVQGFTAGKQDEITKVGYIVVNKTPRAIFTNNRNKVFIPNDPVVFSNFSEDADSYLWNFGDGNTSMEQSPTYFYTEEGEFDVFMIAMTNEGCFDTAYATSSIIAELEGKIRVPNAFTPSRTGSSGGTVNRGVPLGGQVNDVFYALVEGSVKYELNIFNKWGELLFVSKDINIGWDGYYKNELSKQDVYVWKVKVEYADGKTETKVGDLMLLR